MSVNFNAPKTKMIDFGCKDLVFIVCMNNFCTHNSYVMHADGLSETP